LVEVRVLCDEDAKMWVANSGDLPGLVREAPDQDELISKLLA